MLTTPGDMLSTVSDHGDLEPNAAAALHALDQTRTEIESVQRQLRGLRQHRDRQIRAAVEAGASERRAAGSAGVSPSYAHAAAKNGHLTASVMRARRSLTR